MKRIIPHRRPVTTGVVWWPKKVPSRETSRHHCSMVSSVIGKAKRMPIIPCPWNHIARPPVKSRPLAAPVAGQGLNSTRW